MQLVQNLSMRDTDLIQCIRLRSQLVDDAEKIRREEESSRVQIRRISKDKDEKLKLAHKLVNIVDRTIIKLCVTLMP